MKLKIKQLLRLLACIGGAALTGWIIQYNLEGAGYTAQQAALFSLSMGIGVFLLCYYLTKVWDDQKDGKRHENQSEKARKIDTYNGRQI